MGRWDNKDCPFSVLEGKTITEIAGLDKGSESVTFTCSDGSRYLMTYYQDCCASCSIEDVCGDVEDLIGTPVVRAEDPSSLDGFDKEKEAKRVEEHLDSYTWTFYIIGTAKGTVTIRWYGSSNGYYSETPSFELIGGRA